MVTAVSSRDVSRVEVDGTHHHDPKRPGGRTFSSQFLTSGAGAPHAFLVEDEGVTRPHFHRVDQFQVVVSGGGHIGKHVVEPISIHYTDWYTPYGPIVPKADHLSYFTLRAHENPGMYPMPEERAEKERATGRTVTVATELEPGSPVTAGEDGPSLDTVIEPHADGLAAYVARIPAGAALTVPNAAEGRGQYHVVVNGSLVADQAELPPLSLVFVTPDEPAPELRAGAEGAEALVLQFPAPRAEA